MIEGEERINKNKAYVDGEYPLSDNFQIEPQQQISKRRSKQRSRASNSESAAAPPAHVYMHGEFTSSPELRVCLPVSNSV